MQSLYSKSTNQLNSTQLNSTQTRHPCLYFLKPDGGLSPPSPHHTLQGTYVSSTTTIIPPAAAAPPPPPPPRCPGGRHRGHELLTDSSASVIYQQQGLPSFYPATDNAIHWSGRVLRDEESMRVTFDWPGVTASFRVEGNASVVKVLINDTTVAGTRFAVYLGSPGMGQHHLQTFLTQRGIISYPLLSGDVLQAQELAFPFKATLSLVHTQESRYLAETAAGDNVTVVGFATDGFLARPPPAPRKLEFIGDSITAGYGAELAAPCQPSVLTNNHALTWAHLLCQDFGAECFVEAYSGIGVVFSYPDPASPPLTMPERYHDTLASNHQKGEGGHPWVVDVDAFRPDGFLVNLGTNDFCCGGAKNASFVQAYEDMYVKFVMEVVQSYAVPSATEGNGKEEEKKEGEARMRRRVQVKEVMAGLSVVREEDEMLPPGAALRGSPSSSPPAPSYPNEAANQQVAKQALPVLVKVMGWETDK